jgi:hypothetical protein
MRLGGSRKKERREKMGKKIKKGKKKENRDCIEQ